MELSNDSIYFFRLDKKLWPSVTHYIIAKSLPKELEEKVRQAPSVLQAKYLARKNSSNLKRITFELEEKALRAKFSQNPCLMTKLFNMRTIDTDNRLRDAVLNDIRLSSKTKTDDTPDLSSDVLTESDLLLLTNLIAITRRILELEGQNEVYIEIIEDALSNVTRSKTLRREILTRVKEIVGMSQEKLLKRPKLISFIKRISDQIHREKKLNEAFVPRMFGAFLYWIKMEAPPCDRRDIMKYIADPNSISIMMPKKKRWYRSIAPPEHNLLRKPKKKPIEEPTIIEEENLQTIEQLLQLPPIAEQLPPEDVQTSQWTEDIPPVCETLPEMSHTGLEVDKQLIEFHPLPEPTEHQEIQEEATIKDDSITPPVEISNPHPFIIYRTGSILTFEEAGCLAVIVNAKSRKLPSSSQLVDSIFARYPHANVYEKNRYMLDTGTVIPMFDDKEKPVVCIVSEYYDKPPKGMIDTISNRKKWFTTAIEGLSKLQIKSIAFDERQLTPDGYVDTLKEYADKNNVTVFILHNET